MSAQAPQSTIAPQRLRVGVTLYLRDDAQSIWENGALQNVVFLVQLLQRSPLVARAAVVINRDHRNGLPPGLMLQEPELEIMTLPEAMESLDVLIELSALLDDAWIREFRQRGGRTIWMRVGNDYVIDIERAMFALPPASLCNRRPVDAVWTLPEFEHSCGDYFRISTRAPLRVVPHLWTPRFVEQAIAGLPAHRPFGYQPGQERWKLLICEPNVSMVKTCLVPLLAAEACYRAQPEAVEVVRVMNAGKLREHQAFTQMAHMLDLVRHEAVSFDDRVPLYELLAAEGGAVISHHWENGQNYLYYEVLYGGYPLVHNSEFIRDHGYYYPDFDCEAAADALRRVFREHDRALPAYRARARELLRTLDVDHEPNVRAYTEALRDAVGH